MAPYGRKDRKNGNGNRINILIAIVFLLCSLLAVRLYKLQVSQYALYSSRAQNQHERESRLLPERGEIFLTGTKGGESL